MPDIVLTTLNAKYIHPAFGLRYLRANLGDLRPRAALVEFDLRPRPLEIVERLLALEPKLVGFGVYIWNVAPLTEVVALLKRLRPEVGVVLGGPEVSHETESQRIVAMADVVIAGEADLAFAGLCREWLAGNRPAARVLRAAPPEFGDLALPYAEYSNEDIAHRVIYVEASRGCPFSCEFCLSSLDTTVRHVPLARLLGELQRLLDRGARQLKFVDRTFNLDLDRARALFAFCRDAWQPGRLFHFEVIPDRLPQVLREIVASMPPGAFQFEVGIQSFNPEVCARVRRRQDVAALEDNLRFLRTGTGVHVHADLILGLPGESLASMASGFDRLVRLRPQEIQVGMLKRLRGTAISRHDDAWAMVYSPHPPYELLQNKLLDFPTLQRLRRFARYWDLVANSGNFLETVLLLWSDPHSPLPASVPAATAAASGGPDAPVPRADSSLAPPIPEAGSPFWAFLRWSDWLYGQVCRTDSIALDNLAERLVKYLTTVLGRSPDAVARLLWGDYQRVGRRDPPGFLRPLLAPDQPATAHSLSHSHPQPPPHPSPGQKRQARHISRS
ncbi:MAG: DUF4080 domain-containing protein [Verrucomicrobia bacterium]|nr:DUF4080 domain-containing protein [Verrucomicrobiota bacterium]